MTEDTECVWPTRDCPRFGRWIGGCRFEARYDTEPSGIMARNGFKSSYMTTEAVEVLFQKRTYVRDVCIRCGAWISRPHEAKGDVA